ncbi:MAG: hypothetical protein AMJ69_07525 [Gammaproteobacteria bacterium SG8_47]|nr:MAG: hypothetical protein AMJ69_07525 [Gammaproteobacteria bacterium SG8_47]
MNGLRLLLSALLLSCAGLAAAQAQKIEIIELQHRSAAEIIPMVRPFLDADAAVSGTGYKLIVRTSPDNLAAIKDVIRELDGELRRLLISVQQSEDTSRTEHGAGIQAQIPLDEYGRVGIGRDPDQGAQPGADAQRGDVSARVYSTETRQSQPGRQSVQTLEGQWALIRVGQSVPVGQRTIGPGGVVTDTVTYRDVTTGFEVLPRISGQNVTLSIRPHKENLSREGGAVIDTQEIRTTVTGRVGEWIPLGGALERSSTEERGIAYGTASRSSVVGQVLVKVDVLAP